MKINRAVIECVNAFAVHFSNLRFSGRDIRARIGCKHSHRVLSGRRQIMSLPGSENRASVCGALLSFAAILLVSGLVGCATRDWYYSQPKVLDAGGPLARIPAQETFSFVVIGDTRTGIPIFEQHIDEINLLDPDFVIDVGDLINGYTKDAEEIEAMWNEFDRIVARFTVPFVMVAGNHDIWDPTSAEIYRRRYGKTYFSFDHKGAHFIILDSEILDESGAPIDRIAGDQLQWLESDLAKHRNARASFVFLHKPLWPNERTGAECGKHWMDNVHPLLAKYGVSGVFAGHAHRYTSFPAIDGVRYYITGGGGAEVGTNRLAGDFHHYCLVTVRDDRWLLTVLQRGSLQPDIVVTSSGPPIHMAVSPIDVPSDGGQSVVEVSLKNASSQDIDVTIRLGTPSVCRWKVDPIVQTVVIKAGQEEVKRFVASVASTEQPYPGPYFLATIAQPDRAPVTVRLTPYIRAFQMEQECVATVAPPVVDGKLDDVAWRSSQALSAFLTPDARSAPMFPTEVRTAHDRQNLYLAFRCYEPNLPGLVVNVVERDGQVWAEDSVELFIDTNLDRKSYYQFAFDPSAVVYDGIGLDSKWDGICEARTGREIDAWTLEVSIPWSTLQMVPPVPGQRIGFEVVRNRAQSKERTQWSPTFGDNHIPELFGTLIIQHNE